MLLNSIIHARLFCQFLLYSDHLLKFGHCILCIQMTGFKIQLFRKPSNETSARFIFLHEWSLTAGCAEFSAFHSITAGCVLWFWLCFINVTQSHERCVERITFFLHVHLQSVSLNIVCTVLLHFHLGITTPKLKSCQNPSIFRCC